MGPLLAALLLGAALDIHGSISADGSVGNDPATSTTQETSGLSGRVGAAGIIEGVNVKLGYSPQLTWAGATPAQPASVDFYNSGSLSAQFGQGTTRLGLSQSLGFGEQDFSALAQPVRPDPQAPTPPAIDRLPSQRFLPTISSSSRASLQHAFSRTVGASASVVFSIGGGLGHDGRAALPLQRTVSGSISSGWKSSALDDLSVAANLSTSFTSTGERTSAVGLETGWHRQLGPSTDGSLGIGVAVILNTVPASTGGAAFATSGAQAVPTGRLAIGHRLDTPLGILALSASGSAQTGLDPLTGAGYLRGGARLGCGWEPTSRLSLSAAATGDRVLTGVLAGAWGAAGELAASIRARAGLSFRVGLRAALLTPTTFLLPDEAPQRQWTVVAGLTGGL